MRGADTSLQAPFSSALNGELLPPRAVRWTWSPSHCRKLLAVLWDAPAWGLTSPGWRVCDSPHHPKPTEQVWGGFYPRDALAVSRGRCLSSLKWPFLGVDSWGQGRAADTHRSPGHQRLEKRITPPACGIGGSQHPWAPWAGISDRSAFRWGNRGGRGRGSVTDAECLMLSKVLTGSAIPAAPSEGGAEASSAGPGGGCSVLPRQPRPHRRTPLPGAWPCQPCDSGCVLPNSAFGGGWPCLRWPTWLGVVRPARVVPCPCCPSSRAGGECLTQDDV